MSEVESRFTPATDWCPHTEYWHSPDSEATEDEVTEFIGSLVRLIQPEFVLETGSYKGHTTLEISRAIYLNGHGRGESIEVDSELAKVAQRRLDNAMGDNARMKVLNINSMEYEPPENIDFAFFDSWQDGRIQELTRYHDLGFIQQGMVFAVHDTAPHHQVRKHFIPAPEITTSQGTFSFEIIDFHTPRGLILGQIM